VLPWTSITPAAVSEVIVTSAQNAMISLSRSFERHEMVFQITDGFGDVNYARVVFDVVRVTGL